MQSKRKNLSPPPPTPTAKKKELCIIHFSQIKHGDFTAFSDLSAPNERLAILHKVRDRRIAEPVTSIYRMTDICQGIPDEVGENQGYHRGCYQRFNMNLHRLTNSTSSATADNLGVASTSRSKRKQSTEKILFGPSCIFCNIAGRITVKKAGWKTTEDTTFFDRDGWPRVLQIAEEHHHEELLQRIRGFDLFACEAKYHPKCRKKYTINPEHWRSSIPEAITEQSELEAAHDLCFRHVAKYIEDIVLIGSKVVKLSSLRFIYIAKLDETRFANPNFRADRLKRKLEKHPVLGPKLEFIKVQPDDNSWSFYLVYSSSISVGEAISQVYKLASKDAVKDVAILLRGVIQRKFQESKDLPWPPSASDLEVNGEVLPPSLNRFLTLVISGQPTNPSDRAERLILSIGQDLCRAVSNGEWKLPKHILLCMSLRHLYRSRQLITILNRLGHCENYLFSLELETAVAVALEQTSSLITSQIVISPGNAIFHSEWDNFNQLLTGIHGSSAINTSAGIMMQEVSSHRGPQVHTNLPTIPRTKERTMKLKEPAPLPPCHIPKRKGPIMELHDIHQPDDNADALQKGLKFYFLWAICRKASSNDKQRVPALGGFISATGFPPSELTTIDYYPSITEPITQYNVVKELLRQCEEATEEVGQQRYTITTFDLGVVMKAMPIIWDNPARYTNHIILIGPFHTIMNYLNMIGHKMAGSGYSELIIEANLTTSGCLNGVLKGKAYSKSLWCLKVISEAMERLLLRAYTSQRDESAHGSTNADAVDAIIQDCNVANLQTALQDQTIDKYLDDYMAFQERVRQGELGMTASFWISFLDHARRVFMLIYAVKTNELKLYHKCMGEMADLFFSFGGNNYSRYLSWYDVFLTNIEISHPGATQLLEKGAISTARSKTPGNRCAVDKTMEETYMKFAKSRGGASGAGLTGILENYGAYQRWIRTTSERGKYFQATMEMCGLSRDDSCTSGQHRDKLESEIKRSEAAVTRVLDAITGFINPFEVTDKTRLYIISSGNPVPPDVEHDVLRAEEAGRLEREKFVRERLQPGEQEDRNDFFDRVKKMKLKTMEKMNKKVKLSSTQCNAVKYQEQGDVAFQILVKSQLISQPINIEELMTYCITPVPHSLGTPDGFMAKTNKAAAVQYLTKDVSDARLPPTTAGETIFIEDGNAHFHTMKEIPPTFKSICLKVLDQLGHKPDVVFSTDMYVENSVKSQERIRRGSSEKILLEGINTRKPADFKLFLQNDDNKKQLCKMMLRVWSTPEAAQRLVDRKVTLVVEGIPFLLTSSDGLSVHQEEIQGLRSNQEETDSRVVLYLFHAKQNGYKQAVVHSPDSDIFVILLHYAEKLRPLIIYFDTGSGVNRKILNITDIAKDLGPRYCESLLGIYVFTGEDCNCAFKGKGKKTPMKKLEKKPRFQECFTALGDSWDVDDKLIDDLEEFVCFLYGFPRLKDVNAVRTVMLKKMVGEGKALKKSSKVDLSRMPPCRESLVPHIRRANYRAAQWKRSHVSIVEIPPPNEHGWSRCGDYMEPVWSEGPVLPGRLEDIMTEAMDEEQQELEEDASDEDDLSENESDGPEDSGTDSD